MNDDYTVAHFQYYFRMVAFKNCNNTFLGIRHEMRKRNLLLS